MFCHNSHLDLLVASSVTALHQLRLPKAMSNAVESLLQHDHELLNQLLTKLEKELSQSNVAAAFELLDRFWAGLALHIRAEKLQLFPALTSRAATQSASSFGPSADEVVDVLTRLRTDHNFFMVELASAIKTMSGLMSGDLTTEESVASVQNRLVTLRQRIEAHNRLEEEQAYEWPAVVLSHSEQAALCERLKRELENLPPRFDHSSEQ